MTKSLDIQKHIERLAPNWLAEDWDNVGLLVGDSTKEIYKVLISLDATSEVVNEAIDKDVDMIISHHPFIFKGLKRVTEDSVQSRLVYRLIRNDINVYSSHTNFDVSLKSINAKLAEMFGLTSIEDLSDYKSEKLFKLAVFVPVSDAHKVRNAISDAGAGAIGNYIDCTFSTSGTGTFTPLEGTNPYIGTKGVLESVDEVKIETIVQESILKRVISSMLMAHPYEEAAYDIYPIENRGINYGLGKVGYLPDELTFEDFASLVKVKLNIKHIRCVGNAPHKVKKIAIFCGSFDDNLAPVLKHEVDVLITGDIKHHPAIDIAEAGICALDCSHFATEQIVMDILKDELSANFTDVEFIKSDSNKNPISTI